MPRVVLIKGEDRRESVKKSVELISDEIKSSLKSRQVIIKPNFVSTTIQLAASHLDQMRGILDFLKGFYKSRVVIAEAACGDTIEAYKNFGYFDLLKEYDVELIDLNKYPFEKMPIQGQKNRAIYVRVSSLLLDKDNYLISASRLKTHDTVVVTLSIKNMAIGGILTGDKGLVHQGVRQTNINIAEISSRVWPDLSVIDGLEGMEGDGPIHGDSIYVGVAISSTDPLAADRIACEIMGVDFDKVGYLHYCSDRGLGESDLEKIEVLGETLSECVRPFKLHHSVTEQYCWQMTHYIN